MSTNRIRIAYCIEGFYNRGGMERVLSVKANWLAENGYDVTIISASQCGRQYAFLLNDVVRFVDLNVDAKSFCESYEMELRKHLLSCQYDLVISMGGLEIRFLYDIRDKSEKVVELHFAWNRFISSAKNLSGKLKGIFQTIRYQWYLRMYKKIVVLTKYDQAIYRKLGIKTTNIYNPLTLKSKGISNLSSKRIISVGRLDYQKGYDYLIKAWELVEKEHKEWSLDIYGEGEDRISLQKLINNRDLKNICLRGVSTNLCDEYITSSIYVMSSRYEGLGLVLLEAASHGLPLISYDCPAGPNEIIIDKENGFLVSPVGDIHGLADKISYMIENESARYTMGMRALEDSKRFNLDNIMQQWVSLFESAK